MQKSAIFSPDRIHRYELRRTWRGEDLFEIPAGKLATDCMFIGLNPSTADEVDDDPTIRRCIDFATRWGYGGLIMANLFAFRATKPEDCFAAADPFGPDNVDHLTRLARGAGIVIAAWGNKGSFAGRGEMITELMAGLGVNLYCLKLNDDGSPVHPLYQPAYLTPQLF